MPISLTSLRTRLQAKQTILLMGAGAAVPSGAPSGIELAHSLWRNIAKSEPQSDDLKETASILERRFGRFAVVNEVRSRLQTLKATGGLLLLPKFSWTAIYSTNFDRLIESCYKRSGMQLSTIRSNFDFTNKENHQYTHLYKIHGCISQDRAFGDKPSMIITEHDYEEYDKFRQTLFSNLQTHMLTNDVLIIGQSLRDPHLYDLVKKVLALRQEGVSTQVYALIYDQDDLRSPLLEDKGAIIAFGGIDEFCQELSNEFKFDQSETVPQAEELPPNIISSALDIASALKQASNPSAMFMGRSATYSDIRSGATFERSRLQEASQELAIGSKNAVLILGAAGVGKTTFARQVALELADKGLAVWEHRDDFPFQAKSWMEFADSLRISGKFAALLIDECTHYLRQTNLLIDHLASTKNLHLKIICTANAAQWAPRIKSKCFQSDALQFDISTLDNAEINGLINLYQRNSLVRQLGNKEFGSLSRDRQYRQLRDRCSADMFVCLQNIFSNQSLDTILLNEFEELEEALQEYYRYVAALEAVGTRVHRQLLMRMLGIGASEVNSALNGLTGIVDEYDIRPREGIYGWSTRHLVIARIITEYKFSNYDELEKLFDHIISNINPAVNIELQSVRDLCDREHGIGRLNTTEVRQRLYERLIETASGERVPWHRLVAERLEYGSIEDAEITLRNAVETVGPDGPLDRFKVRILLRRAGETKGISAGDRLALVRKAYETAETCVRNHPNDKFAYRSLCDVAVELVKKGESPYILDEAIAKMRFASEEILDPEMDQALSRFERLRARM